MAQIEQVGFLQNMQLLTMAPHTSVTWGSQSRMIGRKRIGMSKGDFLEVGIMAVSLIASTGVISHVAFAVWFAMLTCR